MQKRLVLLIIASLFLLMIIPLSAQSTDEAIPACTEEEIDTLGEALKEGIGLDVNHLQDGTQRGVDVVALLQNTRSENMASIMTTVEALQRHWWDEVVPFLPDCALAVDISLLVGRYYDEALIAATLFLADERDLGVVHAVNTRDLYEELTRRLIVAFGVIELTDTPEPVVNTEGDNG
jgi:hypothetical protein